jgi:hypothetical protein
MPGGSALFAPAKQRVATGLQALADHTGLLRTGCGAGEVAQQVCPAHLALMPVDEVTTRVTVAHDSRPAPARPAAPWPPPERARGRAGNGHPSRRPASTPTSCGCGSCGWSHRRGAPALGSGASHQCQPALADHGGAGTEQPAPSLDNTGRLMKVFYRLEQVASNTAAYSSSAFKPCHYPQVRPSSKPSSQATTQVSSFSKPFQSVCHPGSLSCVRPRKSPIRATSRQYARTVNSAGSLRMAHRTRR